MNSLRIYMLVTVLASITLVNFLAALHGYRTSMEKTQQLFDSQLADTTNLLATLGPRDSAGAPVVTGDLIAFQIWTADLHLLGRSVGAPESPIAPFEPGMREDNFGGHRWRILVTDYPGKDRWVMAAQRIDTRYLIGDQIIVASIIPIMLTLPITGLLVWVIVSYGLKSLKELGAKLRVKRADDLAPVTVEGAPAELVPVVAGINSLLFRLSASFDRERRFAADAAHELRTPISALAVHLHNLAKELPQGNESIRELQSVTHRLSHIVEQILSLYRTNPEHYPARFELLDLQQLCRQVIAESYQLLVEKRQAIQLQGEECQLQGDRFSLQLLVSNLLSNAIKYSPEGGEILVSTDVVHSRMVLTVEDSGPGIDEAEFQRVFERFYRAGGDRHDQDIPGCGLGLSIVQHIASLHEAQIELGRSSFGHGLAVHVSFPRRQRHDEAML